LEQQDNFSIDNLKKDVNILIYDLNINFSIIAKPLRIALTGINHSPSIYSILNILGKQESLQRLSNFINFIKGII
jgi:glutamyl-tRNA synthetase